MIHKIAMDLVTVSEAAAVAGDKWVGRGDKIAADQAAVDAMRSAFHNLDIDGVVVIGEGEIDEAPMLYIGEEVGTKNGPAVDIAVDPLDGTTLTSKGMANAVVVMAVAKRGHLLHAPDMYMEKIAVGPKAAGHVDIDAPVAENIKNVAKALGKAVEDVVVICLDRPRHRDVIDATIKTGARLKLITDGDVAGAIATAIEGVEGDIMIGIGGAPEGVVTAAALRCLGGEMQARLAPRHDGETQRAHNMGIEDINKVFTTEELAKGDDLVFVATGVTGGYLLNGVRHVDNRVITHSLIASSRTNSYYFVERNHLITSKIEEEQQEWEIKKRDF